MQVKSTAAQEKQERELEKQQNMNRNKDYANYRGPEKSKFAGKAPLKSIKA